MTAGLPDVATSSFLGTFGALLRKELALEWRTRARLNALLFFALATLLLFSFALGPDTTLLARGSGGYLWLALLFSSTLSLGESFRVEVESAALEGLRLVPTDARALFLAKALGNALLLAGLALVLLPILAALYATPLELGIGKLVLVVVLGALAISGPGTLQAAIATQSRARDVLLPLLLFPLLVPALLAAAKATTLCFFGDPMGQLPSWLGLLIAFDLIYWGLGTVLFPSVLEG